jgi:hypothetical protein
MLIFPSLQDAAMVYQVFSEISREKTHLGYFLEKIKRLDNGCQI